MTAQTDLPVLQSLLERVEGATGGDRYPDGVGEFDSWRGYRFTRARGPAGIIVSCEEGGGDMPVTFLSVEKAVADLETLRRAVQALDEGAPGSYLGEVVDDIAKALAEPLSALLRAKIAELQKGMTNG